MRRPQRSSLTCDIGFAGKHHSAAHGLRVRRKIAYHELIPVTALGVVVGITVGIEAAKTTKASTKATALETTAAETAVVHREPAAGEPAVVYREAAAQLCHRRIAQGPRQCAGAFLFRGYDLTG